MFARLQFVAALLREDPSAGASAGGRLLWRDGQGRVRVLAVDRPLVVGRATDCAVVLDSNRVSRRHCEVAPDGEGCVLRDLGSSNGTRVNGVALGAGPRLLRDGDVLEAGGVGIVYAIGDTERREAG
jgi:pSer/pThr/pTyr-binding forkhead associated (FHA) protein